MNLGFHILATEGTAAFFRKNNVPCEKIFKVNEGRPNSVDYIKNGKIQLIINTPLGEVSRNDEFAIGWSALEHKISFITTLSAAAAAVKAIETEKAGGMSVQSIQEYLGMQKRA